jgi:hypothetical protein
MWILKRRIFLHSCNKTGPGILSKNSKWLVAWCGMNSRRVWSSSLNVRSAWTAQTLWYRWDKLHEAYDSVYTHSLPPCSTVLLEKLTGLQLVKKFPKFYRTRMFITAFTNASHPFLSWPSLNQSLPLYPTSCRSILILSSHFNLLGYKYFWPIPMAARSEAWACGRSLVGVAGSNPDGASISVVWFYDLR